MTHRMSRDAELLAGLIASARGGRGHTDSLLDGVFKRMLEPAEFQRLVYPGLRPEDLATAPASLQEVLSDSKYTKDVEQLVPLATAKARSVLDAVKARAAREGDVMDAATEASLYPSVFQEAFGRALVSMVANAARQAHVVHARSAGSIASPFAPPASWAQLHPSTLSGLMTAGVSVQDGFCGPQWAGLYASDLARMVSTGRFTPVTTQASATVMREWGIPTTSCVWTAGVGDVVDVGGWSIAWVEPGEVGEEFPAVADLIQRMHALPFELNREASLRLTVPVARSTCASFSGECAGACSPPAVDSGPVGSPSDAGWKVTATYFINGDLSVGGQLGLRRGDSGDAPVWHDRVADRLVLYRSRQWWHAAKPVTIDTPLWALTFYMTCGDDEFVMK